jgi:alpha-glucosidase (family GH31 glycosyl hydrolase)
MSKLKLCVALLLGCIGSGINVGYGQNPVASSDAIVRVGNARFTVLMPDVIRIEYSPFGIFDDRASFVVINRQLTVPAYTVNEGNDGFITIHTDSLTLRYRKGTDPRTSPASGHNLSISFRMGDSTVVWYPGLVDKGNLLGTYRTLDKCDGDSHRSLLEPGLISRSGWAVIDDSWNHQNADGSHTLRFEPNAEAGFDWVAPIADISAMDTYFMCYGHNYKKALGNFIQIAGKMPLPPKYVFGYWYSKWQRYSQQDFKELVDSIVGNDIPADVMVLDTDWHTHKWSGWSWNKELIPDPQGLLRYMHENGLHVSMNLHPAYGIENDDDNYAKFCRDINLPDTISHVDWMLESPKFYRSMFDNIIRLREHDGADFWWLDWQQWLINPRYAGLGETFWCNHVFFNDMKRARPDRRPVIFHRWGGLGSHRYQIGFSGDTYVNYPTLAFEPYFTATASNVCYGYWGHDLGGHLQRCDNDPEMYLRWIQYGIFTPIFRTHATKATTIERRIWKYPNFNLMRDAVKLRYSLFPYIYTMSRKAYDTGVSICRPLYYEYPEIDEAYTNENQYFYGDNILVAPIVEQSDSITHMSTKNIWFPHGNWWSPSLNKMIPGHNDSVTLQFSQAQIPYFYKQGSIIPRFLDSVRSVTENPDTLLLDIVTGADGEFILYEDEGDNDNYQLNAYTTTTIKQTVKGNRGIYTVQARQGQYAGMFPMRSYQINLLGVAAPKSIKVDGHTINSYSYDKVAATIVVMVPNVDADKGVTVEVTYKK